MAVWPLMRGHVYLVEADADDPDLKGQTITKYFVILQGQAFFRKKIRVSGVLATSNTAARDKPWNVYVPVGKVDFWHKDTVISCGDVYSYLVEEQVRQKLGRPVGALPNEVMAEVDLALAISLGLADPPSH